MTDTWALRGSGRRTRDSWDHLHAITREWTAAWAGIDGFHLDRLPDQPPLTTHLWAWTTNAWLRVRIDGPHWWAALLTCGSSEEDELWTAPEPIEEPAITSLRHWPSAERQAMQYHGDEGVLDVHDRFKQLVPLRRTTGVFIGASRVDSSQQQS